MNPIETLQHIRELVPLHEQQTVDGLIEALAGANRDFCLLAAITAVHQQEYRTAKEHIKTYLKLLDTFVPFEPHKGALNTDRNNWESITLGLVAEEEWEGVLYHLELAPRIFREAGKVSCGSPRRTCYHSGTSPERPVSGCTYRFNNIEDVVCPLCGAFRRMCSKGVDLASGRCPSHLGPRGINALIPKASGGRGSIYHAALTNERLKDTLARLMSDEDNLSMNAEIGIIGMRISDLMKQADQVDAVAVRREITHSVRGMVARATEVDMALEDLEEAVSQGNTRNIGRLVTEARAAQRYFNKSSASLLKMTDDLRMSEKVWQEIPKLASTIAELSRTEQKRRLDAQRTVSVENVEMLVKQTQVLLERTAGAVGKVVSQRVMQAAVDSILASEDNATLTDEKKKEIKSDLWYYFKRRPDLQPEAVGEEVQRQWAKLLANQAVAAEQVEQATNWEDDPFIVEMEN
jgi:hypothetical protein